MGLRRRALAALPIVLAAAAMSGQSRAETTPEQKALATSLFRDARRAMSEGRIAEACAKFAESQRIDPGGGTLLNLARCHEREGKTASAWAEYVEARAVARRDRREDRERSAEERIAALEPRVPRLVLDVPESAAVAGLDVTRDGISVPKAGWGTPVPLDPGDHEIAARAPQREPWTLRVRVKDGDAKRVSVPVLRELAPASAPEPAPTLTPPPPSTVAPPSAAPPPAVVAAAPESPASQPSSRVRLYGGIGALAAGGVAIGFGTYYGLRAFSKQAQSDHECQASVCSPQGGAYESQARRAADAATIVFAGAAAAVGLGVYLVLTSPRRASPTVAIAPTYNGVSVSGGF